MSTRSTRFMGYILVAVLGAGGAGCGGGDAGGGVDAAVGSLTLGKISDQTIDEDFATGALSLTVSAATATLTGSSSNQTLVPNASIDISSSGTTRTVTVTPAKNQAGSATITITATSGGKTATTTFNVTVKAVNDPPTVSDILDRSTEEGIALAPIPFTVGDPDNDPGSLTVTVTSGNLTLVPATGLVLGGSGASRTLTVTPAASGTGSALITVKVSDGTLDATDTFTVTVSRSNNVNDPPINKVPGAQKGTEDIPLVFSAVNGNELAVSDVDAGNNAIRVTLAVTGGIGTMTLATSAGLTFQAGDGTADTTMTFTGTIGAINTALNGLTITPPANFNGSGSLTLTTNDQGNTGTGGALQDSDTVQVDFEAVNDPPTLLAVANITILEDGTTGSLAFTIADVDTPLANLTVTRDSSNPDVIPVSGVVLGGSGANRTVTVTPAKDAFGSSVITLAVSDGTTTVTSTFTVTVTAVEDSPTLENIPNQSMNAGQTKTVSFVIGDAETAAADLKVTFTQTGAPVLTIVPGGTGASRSLAITAPAAMNGAVTITVTVTDAASKTATDLFVMTVNDINDPPVLTVPAAQTLQTDFGLSGTGSITFTSANPIKVTDDDAGSASLTLRLQATSGTTTTGALPAGVTRSAGADGSADQTLSGPQDKLTKVLDGLLFTSNAGFAGAASLKLTVDDGGNSGTGGAKTDTKTIAIQVNTRPTITAIANKTINEDANSGPLAFTIEDFEQHTANLTVTATSSNAALVPNSAAGLALGGSGGARTLTVTPLANQNGTSTINVTVKDGDGGETSTSFVLTVSPVNDPPVVTAPATATTTEDVTLVFNGALSVSDVDDTVLDSVTLEATHGTITLGSTVGLDFATGSGEDDTIMVFSGSVADINAALDGTEFLPAQDYNGAATLKLTASDGAAADDATIDLTVTASNDPPVIDTSDGLKTVNTNTDRTIRMTVTDVDVTASQKVEVTLSVDGGATISLPLRTGLTFSSGTGTGGETAVKFQGTLAAVNDALNGASGGVKITPIVVFAGDVTLTATVSDLGNTGPDGTNVTTRSWVTTYTNANTAPTITAISDRTVAEDVAGGNTATFTIGDGQTGAGNLSVTATATPNGGDPVLVTLTVGGSGANRTVTAVPAQDDHGKTTIAVTVSDGLLTKTETYVLTVTAVNDPPVIYPAVITVATLDEDGTIDVSFSATDADLTTPTMAISSNNTTLLPSGSFKGLTTSHVLITPVANQSGTATVTLTASDGTLVDTRVFTVTVRAVNDPPVISGTYPTLTVSDIEVGAGTYQVTIDVTGGTVTLATIKDLTFVDGPDANTDPDGDGNLDSHMIFRGSQAAVNASLDGIIDSVTNGKIVIVVSDLGVSPPTDAQPEGATTLCVAKGTGSCQ